MQTVETLVKCAPILDESTEVSLRRDASVVWLTARNRLGRPQPVTIDTALAVTLRILRPRRPAILSVENLSMGKAVRNTSFTVYQGQITGMFGLVGSGRTETAKIVAGVLKRNFLHGGTVRFDGHPVRHRVPRTAMREGIVYVTEDRKAEGFFETMSIGETRQVANPAATRLGSPVLRTSEARELYDIWKEKLSIRALSGALKAIELSGGNQQKVAIAKALLQKPRRVIFDEPTRGVDVGAIAEIHQMINGLGEEGMAVVEISSYRPEIQNLSDRIFVTRAGRVVAEFGPPRHRGRDHVRRRPLTGAVPVSGARARLGSGKAPGRR